MDPRERGQPRGSKTSDRSRRVRIRVALACTGAAYEAVFGLLFYLFSEAVDDVTIEDLRGLHEELLSADPTELEGADFFE